MKIRKLLERGSPGAFLNLHRFCNHFQGYFESGLDDPDLQITAIKGRSWGPRNKYMATYFIRDLIAQRSLQIAGVSALVVLEGIANSASVIALAPLADAFLHGSPGQGSSITEFFVKALAFVGVEFSVISMGLTLIILTAIGALISMAVDYQIERIRFKALKEMTVKAFDAVFQTRSFFFGVQSHGELINTFIREFPTVGASLQLMGRFFATSAQLIFFLAVPLYISWWVTLVCIFVAGVLGLPFVLMDRAGHRLGERITSAGNKLVSVVHESFGSAPLILSYGKSPQARDSLGAAFDESADASMKWTLLYNGSQVAYRIISVIVPLIGLTLSRNAGLSAGETAALMYALLRSNAAMRSIAGIHSVLSKQMASWDQASKFLTIGQEMETYSGGKSYKGMENGIVLEDLTFSYPGSAPTLKDLNIYLPKGGLIVFRGASGAGKTTLLNIVMGLLKPDQGQVLVDSTPLHELDLAQYRARIGYAPQNPSLFNTSVRNNLLWVKPDATERELTEVCERSDAMGFIRELEHGLDTIVGERGARLSGGQVQRISFARALLRKPEILILDEPFSSIDPGSEAKIMDAAMDSVKDALVLMATHRESILTLSDHVYHLEMGDLTAR